VVSILIDLMSWILSEASSLLGSHCMIKKENADHFLVTIYGAALQEATKSTRTKTLVNKGKTIVAQEDDKEELFLELSQLCNNNKLSLC
jgi:hypothetical protein